MSSNFESAALVALLREGRRPWARFGPEVRRTGIASACLIQELGLMSDAAHARAAAAIDAWRQRGLRLLTLLDPGYPENLGWVADAPPFVFVAGELGPPDSRSVSVVGSRVPSPAGRLSARAMSEELGAAGYTVVSGLAAGIDTEAHTAALDAGRRTIAVIGNGLDHCYPPVNRPLQGRIAAHGAVVSQFWPDVVPSRRTFPMRNGVMSGITRATVIVEASATSGTRIQARSALGQGRAVFLLSPLLAQPWARELAARPGVEVVRSPDEVVASLQRDRALVA